MATLRFCRGLCQLAGQPKVTAVTVPRHGGGDGVIELNVGGKTFLTLRSTLNGSPVLSEYVARAEANAECMKGGAVFVDRDPAQFALILNHLRNKAEGISYHRKNLNRTVQLPNDKGELRDVYMEASHFGLTELSKRACGVGFTVSMAALLSAGNPFDAASKALTTARNACASLLGLGVVAASAGAAGVPGGDDEGDGGGVAAVAGSSDAIAMARLRAVFREVRQSVSEVLG